MPKTEAERKLQRAMEALEGRERARLCGRTVSGYHALLEEFIVPWREFPTWQDAMVARLDWRDVERFCEAMQREWGHT